MSTHVVFCDAPLLCLCPLRHSLSLLVAPAVTATPSAPISCDPTRSCSDEWQRNSRESAKHNKEVEEVEEGPLLPLLLRRRSSRPTPLRPLRLRPAILSPLTTHTPTVRAAIKHHRLQLEGRERLRPLATIKISARSAFPAPIVSQVHFAFLPISEIHNLLQILILLMLVYQRKLRATRRTANRSAREARPARDRERCKSLNLSLPLPSPWS